MIRFIGIIIEAEFEKILEKTYLQSNIGCHLFFYLIWISVSMRNYRGFRYSAMQLKLHCESGR